MRDFFEIVAPFYERLRPRAQKTFRQLTASATFRSTDALIDIGGGTGAVAKFFVGAVSSVTVIDPSPKMLERCALHRGVRCVHGFAEKLPLPDASVEKIIMVDAFHHVPASVQTAAIREIRRVLKPGGTALLVEFDPRSVGGWLVQLFEKIMRMGSTFHAPEKLAELFMANGFTVHYTEHGGPEYVLVATPARPARQEE